VKITVILCTYNRCQSLAKALESVAASELPNTGEWEVLVVDNNSRDQTREVVENFCRRYPGRFRYLFEPQQGLCAARNAGIKNALGEIVAFTDDDVTVDSMWLQNLTAPLQNAEWAASGGRILPARAFSAPPWLALSGPHSLGGPLYAHFDLGDKARELDQPAYGANMAFRKAMFEKYGGFRTDLGRRPGNQIGGEDIELGHRLMAAGERLRYEPSAVVYHEVVAERITKGFFLKSMFDHGRALIRENGKQPGIGGIPKCYLAVPKTIKRMLQATLRWMRASDPQIRFFCKCVVWQMAGQIAETCSQSGQASLTRDVL
jgi:glucosyl-dolichyl phosphate glucuronosyltransferase